jgi:hypothetical protein
LVSIHALIVHEKETKIKPLAGLLVKQFDYDTEAAMLGVPQLLVKLLVLGGK